MLSRRGVEPATAAQRLAVKRDVPARRLAARVASERRRQGVRVESLEEVVIAGVAGRSPALDPEQPQCFRPQPATQRQIALRSFAPASIAARAIPRTDLS